MNQREKILAAVTGGAVVIAILWQMGLGDTLGSIGGGGASSIERRQKEFDENLTALQGMLAVERRYRALGQSPIDKQSELRPVAAFEEFVYSISRRHGFEYPQMRSTAEDVDGAPEYQFLTTNLRTEGPFTNTIAMLKDFDANGLIIRDMELRNTRDRDLMVTRLTIARVARRPAAVEPTNTLFNQ